MTSPTPPILWGRPYLSLRGAAGDEAISAGLPRSMEMEVRLRASGLSALASLANTSESVGRTTTLEAGLLNLDSRTRASNATLLCPGKVIAEAAT